MKAPFTRLAMCALGLLTLLSACLDIKPVPPSSRDAGVGGSMAGAAGSAGAGGASNVVVDACSQRCIDKTPAGKAGFLALYDCHQQAHDGVCKTACSGDAGTNAAPTCTALGQLDPNPTCNACLKDHCCQEMNQCTSSIDCITIGLCAVSCAP